MPYANGFNGDQVSLNYILKTLNNKLIFEPGKAASPEISVSPMGESAFYYKRATASINSGAAGGQVNFVSKGVTRVSIPLDKSVTYGDVIPHVNFATVSPDVVNDRVVANTISVANELNIKALTKIYTTTGAITGTTALTKDNVYSTIIDAKKEFQKNNATKGMKPDCIVVGPSVEALLLKCPEFQRVGLIGDQTVAEAFIGRISGMDVYMAVDLDETTEKVDFIIMSRVGFICIYNQMSASNVDATAAGYPAGVLLAGETVYGFDIADPDLVCLRKHA